MRAEFEGKMIEELVEMQKDCLYKMAGCLCKLITTEIDLHGSKKRIRRWDKGLTEVTGSLLEMDSLPRELAEIMSDVGKEAQDYLFLPKRKEAN